MTGKIVWTPDMSVGVDRLDKDHQALVSYLNDYVEAIDNEEGIFVTDGIFAALLEYTVYHFTLEEQLMEAAGYDDLAAHKEIHKTMAGKVEDCRQRYMLNPDKALEDEVRDFLTHWLQEHILKCDMNYKQAMAEHPDALQKVLDRVGR